MQSLNNSHSGGYKTGRLRREVTAVCENRINWFPAGQKAEYWKACQTTTITNTGIPLTISQHEIQEPVDRLLRTTVSQVTCISYRQRQKRHGSTLTIQHSTTNTTKPEQDKTRDRRSLEIRLSKA